MKYIFSFVVSLFIIFSFATSVSAASCTGSYQSGKPASGTCQSGISCTGGTVYVGACTASPPVSCCASPEPTGGGACTGSYGGKPGTCTSLTACTQTAEQDKDGKCTGATPVCCVSSAADTGTCVPNGGECLPSCLNGTGQGTCTSGTCCKKSGGTPTPGSGGTIELPNPLTLNTVEEVLTALLLGLQGIIVTLALVFLVVGAVLYVTSAGSEKQIETAKGAIFAAMIGLAIGIAAPSFLKEIAKILGWGDKLPANVSASATIATILLNTLNFLLSVLGVLAIVMLVIGGIMYLTSAGNEDQIERGKKILIWSIVGVIVALASLIIVRQIASFFVA